MRAQHTPAPWVAHTSPYLKFSTVVIGELSLEIKNARSVHDARLIAAAPDLLQALLDAIAALGGITSDNVSDTVRTAIARATGETT